jgi:hypothetical protein
MYIKLQILAEKSMNGVLVNSKFRIMDQKKSPICMEMNNSVIIWLQILKQTLK